MPNIFSTLGYHIYFSQMRMMNLFMFTYLKEDQTLMQQSLAY